VSARDEHVFAPSWRPSGVTFDPDHVEILLLIAAIVAMLARRLRLPYTVGLTLAGVTLALVRSWFDIHATLDVHLSKGPIFTALLPPLIFEAAFHIEWRALRTNALVSG
jgi:monovalent cation:H+ antiporter, CPA1 family